MAYQRRKVASGDKCRYYVERDLGMSIELQGRKSSGVQKFKEISGEDFRMRTSTSVHDLISSLGSFSSIRMVWNLIAGPY
jgi:hypothetical protein